MPSSMSTSFAVTAQPTHYLVTAPSFPSRNIDMWPIVEPPPQQRPQAIITPPMIGTPSPPRDQCSNEAQTKRLRQPLAIVDPRTQGLIEFGENFTLALPISKQNNGNNSGMSVDSIIFAEAPSGGNSDQELNCSRTSFGVCLPLVHEHSSGRTLDQQEDSGNDNIIEVCFDCSRKSAEKGVFSKFHIFWLKNA